jgi:hypothetical protein
LKTETFGFLLNLELRGQLLAAANSSVGREHLVRSGKKGKWASEPIWMGQ